MGLPNTLANNTPADADEVMENFLYLYYITNGFPEGTMINGKISPTVDSNNLTVALKTKAGTDPSATDPVYVMIGGVLRSITSALSVVKNAGQNYSNAGSAELATKEIDWFTYLTWNTIANAVSIGFSRISHATLSSSFDYSAYSAEKNCHWSTDPNATDVVVNIGRFAATLSAGAGYTWTVPTYTTSNLIQRPIYETRWLEYQPVYTGGGNLTYTSVTELYKKYKIRDASIKVKVTANGTITNASAGENVKFSMPFACADVEGIFGYAGCYNPNTGSTIESAVTYFSGSSLLEIARYNYGTWVDGSSRYIYVGTEYEI